jgi:hypothetical protein
MFLIEALRSNTLDTKRAVVAPKEATPRTVKASADCNHKQVAPNPRKKLPSVGTLLFVSLNIEVGYCREVEPDGIEESPDVRYLCCPAGCDCRWLSDFWKE